MVKDRVTLSNVVRFCAICKLLCKKPYFLVSTYHNFHRCWIWHCTLRYTMNFWDDFHILRLNDYQLLALMVRCLKQTRWVDICYNNHVATLVWITWKTLTHKLFKVFCCYPKYILFLDFRGIKSIYAMVKNSFVCILNYVSGFCAKKHKYTHRDTIHTTRSIIGHWKSFITTHWLYVTLGYP